ncbi:CMGC/SRPK protein kinase [Coprinopsis cinerea okayama7|uniref:CMGC/SRPK protein kinase n=1 Tax=Coprinopsis cinerea (strain Okayama-7 / 130 / ATCC MYA-4618 / FGSC 9003) TaxID=240176 RepID=D6RQN6_COPC7|nr:CMGC/SRPK protein kinase [Coprinopsis cinerea okayama7\|eukprot:XP_002910156.1 CMGC/SRPK protein kinase [Coprinopsis cinerea okayama7\
MGVIVGKLGYGTWGTAWLRRDLVNHQHVTVKIGTPRALENELRVLKHLKSLNSKHFGASATRPLIDEFAIEGADGVFRCAVHPPLAAPISTFRKALLRTGMGGLPVPLVKALVTYLLEAVDFLHSEAKVVHTDIQESNILLGLNPETATADLQKFEDEEIQNPSPRKINEERVTHVSRQLVPPLYRYGPPTLCDFGEARFGEYDNMFDIQPYQYRAPEVIFQMGWDEKVDIWSIGVMLWDLIENKNLFKTTGGPDNKDGNNYHVAHMIALLGPPPKDFLERTKETRLWNWFDKDTASWSSPDIVLSIFFSGAWKDEAEIPAQTLENTITRMEGEEKALFINFARRILKWKPEERCSAKELSEDPWIRSRFP